MQNNGIIRGSGKLQDLDFSVQTPVVIALISGFAWFSGADSREVCLGPSRFYISYDFPEKGIAYEGAMGIWFGAVELESPEFPQSSVCKLDRLSEVIIEDVFFKSVSDYSEIAAAISLICRRLRNAELWDNTDVAEDTSSELSIVEQACQFIRDNFENNLSLEIISKHCNVSTRTLTAGFRKSGLPSPMKYLANLKAERARDMLENNDYSISQIATFLGFSEVAAFSHFFRKQTGKSPREFRDDVNWLL